MKTGARVHMPFGKFCKSTCTNFRGVGLFVLSHRSSKLQTRHLSMKMGKNSVSCRHSVSKRGKKVCVCGGGRGGGYLSPKVIHETDMVKAYREGVPFYIMVKK